VSRHAPARGENRRRILATALSLGLLLPGVAMAAPAAADSEILSPLDQADQFDETLPVLDESVLQSLQGLDAAGPSAGGTERSARNAAPAATAHLGPCAQDFIDAPPRSTYYTHITWMACAGLTTGYQDNSFGVRRQINRGEAALMLYRLSGDEHDAGSGSDFTDVTPVGGGEEFTAISWMADQGIVHGYHDGTFRPDRPISRGELASYLFRYAGDEDFVAPARAVFSDVPVTAGAYRDISWLVAHKMVNGYSDRTFRPTRSVTRGETAKYLYGLEVLVNGRPAPPAIAPKPAPKPQPTPQPQPAPAPEVPLAYRYVVIADDGLNVRKGPGTQHAKVTSLLRNTKVVITGRSQVAGGATWREITVGKHRGWVHGGYIIKDFELGNAKSSLARTGTLRKPTTRNGVTVLDTTWQAQPNGYWCGPASIKIALEAFGLKTTQNAMAKEAQTDREGTWLHQVARVLDYNAPTSVRYSVTTIRGQDSTREDRIRIREDLKRSIRAGVPAVVNIAATPGEQPPLQRQKTGGKFTLRHHMPVVGYNENNNTVLVQDPWTKPFWISVYQLADMAGTRGYASLK
jgi:hypothetical protein